MQNITINFISSSLWLFIDTLVAIVFVIFVDAISITYTVSSLAITEISAILFEDLLISQVYVLGFQP